jgi:hypothetical protein
VWVVDKTLQGLGMQHQKIHVLSKMSKSIACSAEKAEAEPGYRPFVGLPRRTRCKSEDNAVGDMLRFPSAARHDPAIDRWLRDQRDGLRPLVEEWFARMRQCGGDVRELMHDGCPTACVGDAPFGYVNAFKDHVNVGFFHGAFLEDPARLLEGTGKRMRHVKLRPGREVGSAALGNLIDVAYADIRARLEK